MLVPMTGGAANAEGLEVRHQSLRKSVPSFGVIHLKLTSIGPIVSASWVAVPNEFNK